MRLPWWLDDDSPSEPTSSTPPPPPPDLTRACDVAVGAGSDKAAYEELLPKVEDLLTSIPQQPALWQEEMDELEKAFDLVCDDIVEVTLRVVCDYVCLLPATVINSFSDIMCYFDRYTNVHTHTLSLSHA